MPDPIQSQSSSNNSTNQAPPRASSANPIPDFNQAEFDTNPQYRDHISARLSKQYGSTFAKYVIEMTSAKPKGVLLSYYQFAVKRT